MNDLFSRIKVIYEDDSVVVINKPHGLVVTPGPGYEEDKTLVGWLINRYGESLRTVGVQGHRPGIVHRLDKDTSGVMIAAKTQKSFLHLTNQFLRRRVGKRYVVVVWGDVKKTIMRKMRMPEGDTLPDKYVFVVNAPLGRNPKNRMRVAVTSDGKPSITKFRIEQVKVFSDHKFTVLSAYPKTGRTHQIRVHIKSLGHSVLGDVLYQGRKQKELFKEFVRKGLERRMYLHAYSLRISTAQGNNPQRFVAPVPSSFKTILGV